MIDTRARVVFDFYSHLFTNARYSRGGAGVEEWVTPTTSMTLGIIRVSCSMLRTNVLDSVRSRAVSTVITTTVGVMDCSPVHDLAGPSESASDRHRRCEPAFGQLNRPMEPTSEPRRHHQSPMSIRLKCGQSTMPRNPPLAPTSARQRRRLEWRDPHGTPHCSGPALGPLGRPPGAPEGPEQPDEGWRPQCGLENH